MGGADDSAQVRNGPKLAVLTGDFVDGSRATDPARAWRDAVAPIEARDVPWAAVFGNHDDAGGHSREVLGTFCGHDHANDFEARLHGLRLCYGRATGYNTYGHDGFARGVRVIQLVEGRRDFATWLRLDDPGFTRIEQAAAGVRPRDA